MAEAFTLIVGLAQGLVLIALAPGLLGLLRWYRAWGQGRRRGLANLSQPYRDLARLLGQPPVRARTASPMFAVAPLVLWGCYGTLAFAVPLLGQPPLLRIDLITLVYMLAAARFTLALAGLDAGAPFGGLGSSRAMFLNLPTEVALALIGAALALHWGTLDIWGLTAAQRGAGFWYWVQADLFLVAIALAITISLELGRIPFDNPATHLELTMAQKAILLEYGGRDLALIEAAEAVKLGLLLGLLTALFLLPFWPAAWPVTFHPIVSLAFLVLAILFFATREIQRPKLRLRKVKSPAILTVGFSLLAILYQLVHAPGG